VGVPHMTSLFGHQLFKLVCARRCLRGIYLCKKYSTNFILCERHLKFHGRLCISPKISPSPTVKSNKTQFFVKTIIHEVKDKLNMIIKSES